MNMIKILCPLCTLPVCGSCIPCLVLSVFSQRCSRRRRLCSPVSLRSKRFRFVLAQIKNEEGQPKTARKSRSLVYLSFAPNQNGNACYAGYSSDINGQTLCVYKIFHANEKRVKKKAPATKQSAQRLFN